MTASLTVPVVDVQNDNFKELWPAMVIAIKTSSFVALDTELSGLGNRKSLLAESIEDRYRAICHAARSRSILSLGIACYKKLDKSTDKYLVQVYNLTLLCSEEYIIEPQAVQFLVQHGFDFNKQYAHGIPYCKGDDKGGADGRGVHIRALFTELLRANKPLVLHNGLIDIVFLYQAFYSHVPERLATFTADLSDMFPAGIYDTKYISDFELRLAASYLEYAYKKCKLDNNRLGTPETPGNQIHIEFCHYNGNMSTYVDYRTCPAVVLTKEEMDVCERFSAFGWCPNGTKCLQSHNTDLIVLQDEKTKQEKKKKRKRRKDKKHSGDTAPEDSPQSKVACMEVDVEQTEHNGANISEERESSTSNDGDGNTKESHVENMPGEEAGALCEQSTCAETTVSEAKNPDATEISKLDGPTANSAKKERKAEGGTHRAGFDAFMTGYIFAFTCAQIKNQEKEEESEETLMPSSVNKVYLSGKAAPLNIVKSTFAKSSKAHMDKMKMVWSQNRM
ncbi:target of EGR1 protein 1 [Synchiropus picturatus]